MTEHAENEVIKAEQALARSNTWVRRLRFAGLTILYGVLVALLGVTMLTLYEIHSCVTPGWPCHQRAAENTAEIVVNLNEGHVEISGDLDDVKRMLREIKRMQGETNG